MEAVLFFSIAAAFWILLVLGALTLFELLWERGGEK